MRARSAATAACVAAALLARAASAVVIGAANGSSFTVSFRGGTDQPTALRFSLSFADAAEAAAEPVMCGTALAIPGVPQPTTLTLLDLPESARFELAYTLFDGADASSGSAWVVLPSADAVASDTCWTGVLASLSFYSVAWSRALRRDGGFAPAAFQQRFGGSCACWVCDGAGGACRSAPREACAAPAPDLQSPPNDDNIVVLASPALPPPLPPPPPASPPLPWFLEYWPQLAVPPAGRPPPPAVSGLAGPVAVPPARPPPWWLGSRGTSSYPSPPPLQSNTTADVPWWALLGEESASPPPPSPSGADVFAQMLNVPPGPPGDTTPLQQALEGWLSAVPSLAAPAGGGTSPASVLASVLADMLARKEAARPSAAAATVIGLGAAAASSWWGLWTSPVFGPYLLELLAQAESAVWPGAKGAG